MTQLPFRQVHLDFHTSQHIPDVGRDFDPEQFTGALQRAKVNSITLFAKCHHGWSYYDTKVGQRHPNLKFDLLRAQYEACLRAGIAVEIYLTAGWDERNAFLHPEWRQIAPDGTFRGSRGKNLVEAGWKDMCCNSPYLDVLCNQIREVAQAFPKAAGLFMDIVRTEECCCSHCLSSMTKAGLDWTNPEHRRRQAVATRDRYYQAATAAARTLRPGARVFHNTSHLAPGDRSIVEYFTHFELESLPTGGWGYDHLPLSAAYARTLNKPYLGMTGKFHTFWGEYGGYKHPNALRYECALMLALGAGCSIGDQLDPTGRIDETTYSLIGRAYQDVEAKEPWCINTEAVSDVALFSPSGHLRPGSTDWESRRHPIDAGCARLLLESHVLFDVVDGDSDFTRYALLVLPDVIRLDDDLARKVKDYLAQGGKVLMTGESGLRASGDGFAVDIGAEYHGVSPFDPDYMLPVAEFRSDYVANPMVMYAPSQRIRATSGRSLGQVFDPYFNRTAAHFCNHIHTPRRPEPSGFDCGVVHDNLIYLAHPVFSIYRDKGSVALKQVVQRSIDALLGNGRSVECNLPSYGRVTLRRQAGERRHVVHLLCVATMSRGTVMEKPIDVIEDLVPVHDVQVRVRSKQAFARATMEPQGTEIPLRATDGSVSFTVPVLDTHQMVVLHHKA
jgi:hypothetical protein